MPYGMYLSAEGARAQSQRLEVIANNLANVDTVGFKPEVATFQSRFAEAIQQGDVSPGQRGRDDVGGGVKVIDVVTDFSAGRLQRTGNQLDMTIIGPGYFAVAGEGNEPLLTRAGDFTINNRNQLVTQQGQPVLDAGGSAVTLQPGVPWTLSSSGLLQQGDTSVALAILEPSEGTLLQKVGSNQFRAMGAVAPTTENAREVRQNFLEMSGTNPTQQMMAMIETTRAFEANMRMVQNHDSLSGSLLGRVLQA